MTLKVYDITQKGCTIFYWNSFYCWIFRWPHKLSSIYINFFSLCLQFYFILLFKTAFFLFLSSFMILMVFHRQHDKSIMFYSSRNPSCLLKILCVTFCKKPNLKNRAQTHSLQYHWQMVSLPNYPKKNISCLKGRKV